MGRRTEVQQGHSYPPGYRGQTGIVIISDCPQRWDSGPLTARPPPPTREHLEFLGPEWDMCTMSL